MQEAALVALNEEEEIYVPEGEGGYGRETDWWSLGATVYELVYGIAPFFANDIRGTYELIMNHEVCSIYSIPNVSDWASIQRKLRFPSSSDITFQCVSFISGYVGLDIIGLSIEFS
jgi:serine/threonine protein kinase